MESIKCNLLSGNQAFSAMSQLAESLGGEETMKEKYPRAYQAYQQSMYANTSNRDAALSCDIDILHVAYANKAKDKICIKLCSEFEKELGLSIQNVTIVDCNTQKVLSSNENRNYLGAGIKNELVFSLDGCNIDNLEMRIDVHNFSDTINSYNWRGYLSGFKLLDGCQFTVTAPKITHRNPSNQKINVSLFSVRGYQIKEEDLDYWYPESWNDRKFRLESKGKISVLDANLTGILAGYLTVTTVDNKIFYHNNAVSNIHLVNSHLIEWDIPKDWGFPFDLMELKGAVGLNDIEYTLSIQATCSDGKRVTFCVSNDKSASGESCYLDLPKICLYVDCLVKGTWITMADGSRKNVERLQPGDCVGCEYSTARVRFAESSKTKMALGHLVLENGYELFTTLGHVVATEAGLICLSLLSAGDTVMTDRGPERVRKMEVLPTGDCEIVAVSLSTHQMYANGILVGDSEAVLTEEEKAANIRLRIPEEWRKDYDSWVARK